MIDHTKLFPRILEKMFPQDHEQDLVMEILGQYGHADFQREWDRVGMAILKLAGKSPERIRYYTLMACRDYRDVVSAAEYPNQMGNHNLLKTDPAQYDELIKEDLKQYQDWYLGVLWDGVENGEPLN